MKFAFIDAEKAHHPVEALCRNFNVSRSGFYAWKRRAPSATARRDVRLGAEVVAIHARSRGTYGSPRIHAELAARGEHVARKRVARLMSEQGLSARRKRTYRTTTDSNHTQPTAPNVLARSFSTTAPNEVWVTDVTAVWTAEGWLYLAALLDLFSRRVVGWAMSETNDAGLALSALRAALRSRRPPEGLLHHSDRGSPYASQEYRAELAAHGLRRSMSRRGNCWDNAVAESFFSSLKTEHVPDKGYPTRAAARVAINEYIDSFYNLTRRHSHNGYLSPIEFELKRQAARHAA